MSEIKPIFSICIPTYNRGKLALKLVQGAIPFLQDNWEILILDNASNSEVDEYKKIEELSKQHANVRYVRHVENRLFHGNYIASFKYVSSKYFMIVSDEDMPDMQNIPYFIEQFDENENLGILRGSVGYQGDIPVGNSYECVDSYFKSGEEALMGYSFYNNYLPGVMYNIELINKHNFVDILEKNVNSHLAYPHLFFEQIIISKCDVALSSKVSVYEGEPQVVVDARGTILGSSDTFIGVYSLGDRLNQFKVLRDSSLESVILIDGTFDGILYLKLYLKLIAKYYFLITQVQEPMYTQHHIDNRYVKDLFKSMVYASVMTHQDLEAIRSEIFKILDDFFRENYSI